MTRKRIRQMNAALLRRLSRRPAAEYLAGREDLVQQLVGEGYFQRFVPLMADRVSCAGALDLCREDLERLDGPEPREGWLPYCYGFARRLLFPEKHGDRSHGAGAVFFLSVLQVLLDAERELRDYDPAWDFAPPISATAQRGMLSQKPQLSMAVTISAGSTVSCAAPIPAADMMEEITPCTMVNRAIISSNP